MKTNKYLVFGLLTALTLASCSNDEETVGTDSATALKLSAGIGQSTRAVIDADYGQDLNVSFVRLDNPGTNDAWSDPAINAIRMGGAGNTAVMFATTQTYSAANGESALIGYHPQATLATSTNPATVSYTITGDEDIMATEVQRGAANKPFTPFTFQHLLTQLQFKCVGSTAAAAKWTAITSIKVKSVSTVLTLSLNKTGGASLTNPGTPQDLAVVNCPTTISLATAVDAQIGYLMLHPAADMGTAANAISLEVAATYEGAAKTVTVPINNIADGVKAGESHLITLNFTIDGEIQVEAGIAEWVPGNGGSSSVKPK